MNSARPIISEADRVTMLSALKHVDYALIAPEPGDEVPTVLVIRALLPDIFATSDNRLTEYRNDLAKIGVLVEYVQEIRITSTTEIIRKIRDYEED